MRVGRRRPAGGRTIEMLMCEYDLLVLQYTVTRSPTPWTPNYCTGSPHSHGLPPGRPPKLFACSLSPLCCSSRLAGRLASGRPKRKVESCSFGRSAASPPRHPLARRMGYPAHLLSNDSNGQDGADENTIEITIEEDTVPTRYEVQTFGATKAAYFASQPKPKGKASLSSTALRAAGSSVTTVLASPYDKSQLEVEDIFSARETPLVASVYARYKVTQEKANDADIARVERLMRDEMRRQNAQQQYEDSQRRRARVRGRNEKAKNELVRSNLDHGRRIRHERGVIEAKLEEQRQLLLSDVQARVARGRRGGSDDTEYETLDARLDAQEEAAAEALRQEHTKAREERHAALQSKRSRMQSANKEHAESVRKETSERLHGAMIESQLQKALQAEEKRIYSDENKALHAEYRDEHLQKAGAAKAFAKASLNNAKRAKEQLAARKAQEVAAMQRTAAQQVAANRERMLRANQARRRAVFASRYANRDALKHFSGSTFHKLYEMDDTSDAQINEGNIELFQRIAYVAPRTDDLIDDDVAGKARKTFAERSRAQKASEARRIARENDELKKRVKNAQASTDNMLDDEAAAVRRIEMAAESKARRAREAVELAVRNEELQRRLHAVKAVTDDNILDEAAGAARARAAAASAASRAAEAARLARQNLAMRRTIANTAPRTDDDVTDEDAGHARGKMEAESKARRTAQAKKLAKSNSDMKTRLKNVKASVDDDITDDPAGKVRKGGWFALWGS